MKRSYTVYSSVLNKLIKKAGLTPEQYSGALTQIIKEGSDPENAANDYVTLVILEVEKDLREGKAIHLFLPDISFLNWLVGCVPVLENDHAGVLMESIGSEVICLHFPSDSKKSSCVFTIPKLGHNPDGTNAEDYGCIFAAVSSGNADNLASFSVRLNGEGSASEAALWYVRLVLGLGMYVSCFPEVVKAGPPEDIKHPAFHNHKTSRTIGLAEAITESHGSPSAHFRRGHFRVLRSEKFTKKRFQVVFVKETFVGGKAKTILEPEEV